VKSESFGALTSSIWIWILEVDVLARIVPSVEDGFFRPNFKDKAIYNGDDMVKM
jgi:hypothetical protein